MSNLNLPANFDYKQFRADLEPILEKALCELYDEGEKMANLSRSRIKFLMADVAYQALTLMPPDSGKRDDGWPVGTPRNEPKRPRVSGGEGIKSRTVVVKDSETDKLHAFYIAGKVTVAVYVDTRQIPYGRGTISEVEWWDNTPPELYLTTASQYLADRVHDVLISGKFDSLQDHLM